MNRPVLAVALALTAPAYAQPAAGYYVAVPVGQPAKAQVMTRATLWSLHQGSYVADRAPERDAVVCQLIARDVGVLHSFSAGGRPLDDEALQKCNASAK